MTKENKKKLSDWLRDNLMLLIITALLSVIGYGGMDILEGLKHRQDIFDSELKTYREVQMGILSAVENDRTASGFWFDKIDANTDLNCLQEKAIQNHEIRIRSLEDN